MVSLIINLSQKDLPMCLWQSENVFSVVTLRKISITLSAVQT